MPSEIDLARRSHALLMRAMDHAPDRRRDFIRAECADEPALLQRAMALVDAADKASTFLERPALEREAEDARAIPDAVGNYLVIGVLGVGGMATVYEAIQEDPRRRVALKVLNQTVRNSDAYMRFRFETEALARLHHPGIAQIYEAGAAQLEQPSPAPFFAMELIPDAAPITTYADRHGLTKRQRIELFLTVCDAVHHGHQHGVIHRDLKPANVLVDGEGRAKVIDFGVARATEAHANSPTSLTGAHQIVGTLHYMSPEQCGVSSDIDIRTDIYSLGVLLYELTCGRLPHDLSQRPIPAALHAIIHEPHIPPTFLDGQPDRDLEAIINKAIEKEPGRRYESAAALAADLRRALAHQPIEARPPGVLDQLRLFARRNPAFAGVAASIVASIVLIAAISAAFALRLNAEMDRRGAAEAEAVRERDQARWQAYTAQIAGALSAMKTGEFEQMRSRLRSASHQPRNWEWGFLDRLSERSATVVQAHDDMILELAPNRRWTRFLTIAGDGVVRVWNASSGEMIATATTEAPARAWTGVFTVEGDAVVIGDLDGAVRVLDPTTLEERRVLGRMPAPVRAVAAMPGGRIAAACDIGEARIWTLDPPAEINIPNDHPGGAQGLAASPDGSLLATYSDRGDIEVRRAGDLSLVRRVAFPGALNQVCFSEDARQLAAVGGDNRVFVWALDSEAPPLELQATEGVNTVRSVAFSHDGRLLAAGLVHRGIVLFSLPDGERIGDLGGHTSAIASLSFRPDDQLLVSASWDRTIRTWKASEFTSPGGVSTLSGHGGYVMSLAFTPDGSMLASGSRDGAVILWDPDLTEPIARLDLGQGEVRALAMSPDGRRMAAGTTAPSVVTIDTNTGRATTIFNDLPSRIASVAFDAAGQRIAAGAEDGSVRIWTLGAATEPLTIQAHGARVNSVCFSPDGSVVATGSRDRAVRLWNANTGAAIRSLDEHQSDVFAVLFSPDGARLYSGARDETVRAWDVATGDCVATIAGHGQIVTCLSISPDGSRLAAGSWFGEIVLFDIETLDLIASFRAHDSAIRGVAFSPDGRWLASGSFDSTVRLFDSASRAQADESLRRSVAARDAAVSRVHPVLAAGPSDADGIREALAGAGLDPEQDPWARKALLSAFYPPSTSAESGAMRPPFPRPPVSPAPGGP